MTTHEFDVIVLGAGPAGEVCAGRIADRGDDLSVAIVERELVGGECSFYACMPSKALLRPGELLAEARRVPGVREAITGSLDIQAVLERRDAIVHGLDDAAQVPWLETRGIELFRGHGVLDGERRVRVGDGIVLRARRAVVIATGSTAAMPPIEGLAEARPCNNRQITTAKAVPERLIMLGGGVVGCEMAQAWTALGSKVTLIEGQDRLLSGEEPFAGEQVAASLRAQGAEVLLGRLAGRVQRSDGTVTVTLDGGEEVTGDEIAVAVGRRPATVDIGLETVGLEPGRPIEVDDTMRVSGRDWLYAVGDVNGRVLLTHMGKYQARIAADNVLGRRVTVNPLADGRLSPRVTFTDPQVAAVGHTLASAQAEGLDVRAVDVPTEANAGGSFVGRDAPGTSRLVVDEQRGVLVGATFTGPETADFVHAATIAVVGEVPLFKLWEAIPSFPARSEVWLKLLEEYGL
jgi:pyruvate/2-oxoglutarate dehydrogenase complex dihydrolipoamide dehydrogenase (E3) component